MKQKKYVLMNDYNYDYRVCENDGDFSLRHIVDDYIWEFIEHYKLNSMCQYTIVTVEETEKEVKRIMQTTDGHTIIFTIKEIHEPSKWDIYKI